MQQSNEAAASRLADAAGDVDPYHDDGCEDGVVGSASNGGDDDGALDGLDGSLDSKNGGDSSNAPLQGQIKVPHLQGR